MPRREVDEVPKSIRLLSMSWPILVALAAGGATMVRADAKIHEVEVEVNELKEKGAPPIRERLARMEVELRLQGQQQDRIEEKLDRLYEGGR